jgi:fluoride exporter
MLLTISGAENSLSEVVSEILQHQFRVIWHPLKNSLKTPSETMSEIGNIILIATGAVSGAMSRFYITEWINSKFAPTFPLATLGINFTGCLFAGFLGTVSSKIMNYSPELDLLIRTGFLGSYTTFSTYGFDTLTLWRNKKFAAGLYGLGSLVFGVGAVILGSAIASAVLGKFR